MKDLKNRIKRQNSVYQLWRKGKKPKKIAEECGISYVTVGYDKCAVYNRCYAEAWRINNSALY
jgi:DNA-binding NarL/FixJ family response regulator